MYPWGGGEPPQELSIIHYSLISVPLLHRRELRVEDMQFVPESSVFCTVLVNIKCVARETERERESAIFVSQVENAGTGGVLVERRSEHGRTTSL